MGWKNDRRIHHLGQHPVLGVEQRDVLGGQNGHTREDALQRVANRDHRVWREKLARRSPTKSWTRVTTIVGTVKWLASITKINCSPSNVVT